MKITSGPRKKWRWAFRTLGIEGSSKNAQRVIHGIKFGSKNARKETVGHNQRKLKFFREEIFKEAIEREML